MSEYAELISVLGPDSALAATVEARKLYDEARVKVVRPGGGTTCLFRINLSTYVVWRGGRPSVSRSASEVISDALSRGLTSKQLPDAILEVVPSSGIARGPTQDARGEVTINALQSGGACSDTGTNITYREGIYFFQIDLRAPRCTHVYSPRGPDEGVDDFLERARAPWTGQDLQDGEAAAPLAARS